MKHVEPTEINRLRLRIAYLERELAERPTLTQVEEVRAFARRREILYGAVLKRNEILNRKLEEKR